MQALCTLVSLCYNQPMETSVEILIIMLSVVLIVFLVVAIILSIHLIRLTKKIQNIAETTGKIAEDARGVADNIKAITSPIAIGAGIVSAIEKLKSHKKKSAHKSESKTEE